MSKALIAIVLVMAVAMPESSVVVASASNGIRNADGVAGPVSERRVDDDSIAGGGKVLYGRKPIGAWWRQAIELELTVTIATMANFVYSSFM